MPPKTAVTPKPHMGRKIEKIRTLKGIKQDALAKQLGITQSALSKIERSEEVEEDKLEKIAAALEMSADAIRAFNEEAVIHNIQNFYDNSEANNINNAPSNNHFNPHDKYVESVGDIKKLYQALLDEKDRTINEKDRIIKMLEELLKNKGA